MLRAWLNRLWQAPYPPRQRRSPARSTARLDLERLEAREVPTNSPFFLDTASQLWAATDATGQTYQATGGFGLQLSVGEVAPGGGGGEIAVIRDGTNRVHVFNGNNNVFTDTGAYAIDIVAGRGQVFLRDGNNQIHILVLGALNPNGTFAVTATATAGSAIEMSVGFDNTTAQDFLAFRAGDNTVHMLERVGGVPVYGATGAYTIDLEAGLQKETFIRDGNNQVYILTINTATAAGITFLASIDTPAYAVEMSVGRASPVGNDDVAYRAGDNSVHFITFIPGGAPTFVSIPGAFALQVKAGSNEIFIRDGNNQVWYFEIIPAGTGTTTVMTSASAIDLRVTRFSLTALPIDQLAILDGTHRLFVSQNNGGGTAIASFFDTGFIVSVVEGLPRSF